MKSSARGGNENPLLTFHKVSKHFGEFQALNEVSFSVHANEVVCLLGPSGSGKSTLLRCVNRLESFESGSIEFDGQRVESVTNVPAFRRQMGMVFQSFELFPHMTAIDNVTCGPIAVLKRPREIARDAGMALLRRVGLEDKAASYPSALSGGQQQRVAIARALAMEPRLMLFDEPTSALDPETVNEVLSVMTNLAADSVTMLVVTHEISFARRVADWVVVMDRGSVVEQGTPADVIDRPKNSRTAQFLAHQIGSGAPVP